MQFLSETLVERPATRARIRQLVTRYLRDFPKKTKYGPAAAVSNSGDAFKKYTGVSQNDLLTRWFGPDMIEGTADDTTSRFTTCNAFLGKYAHTIVTPGQRKGASFMGFYFEKECQDAGLGEAWFSQAKHPDLQPGFGDLVKFKRHHVAAALESQGGFWDRIEGGQGGRKSKWDVVMIREKEPYRPSEIEGWVNLAILMDYNALIAERDVARKRWADSPWDTMREANRTAHRNRSK